MRSKILHLWLAAVDRDDIARKTGVGAGTVSNVISEFKHQLPNYDIDALRELGVAMKNANTTPQECTDAVRTLSTLAKTGVGVEDLGLFINDIYKACLEKGLPPEGLVELAKQLFNLSKSLEENDGEGSRVPIQDLPRHVGNLKRQRDDLEEQVKDLANKKTEAKAELAHELQSKETSLLDLQQFVAARQTMMELGGGLSINENLPKLANMLKNAKQLEYDASKIVGRISMVESLQEQQSAFRAAVEKRERQERHLARQCQTLQDKVNSYLQTIELYEGLKEMGFGLNELRLLHGTLAELVNANVERKATTDEDIPGDHAVRAYFKDLKELYSQQLGYEEKLWQLKNDIQVYNDMVESAKKRYADRQALIETINIFREKGFGHDDIVYLGSIVKRHGIGKGNKEKFAADLDSYGRIEEAIIESSERLKELETEASQLAERKVKLMESVEELEYKKDVIVEYLTDNSELAQAIFAATRAEGVQSITELTKKAKEGIEICRQLLDESRLVSEKSVSTVSKLGIEVNKQVEYLLKLDGFKDFAELIRKHTSTQDFNELLAHPRKSSELIMHTMRVLQFLTSIYERAGPNGASIVRQLEAINSSIMFYLATYRAKANSIENVAENAREQQQQQQEKDAQNKDQNASETSSSAG